MKEITKHQLDQLCRITSAFFAITVLLFTIIYVIPRRDIRYSSEENNYIESFVNIDNQSVNIWNFKGSKDGTNLYCTIKNGKPGNLVFLQTQDTYIDVYVGDKLIFSDDRTPNSMGLSTNGCVWRKISLGNIQYPVSLKITCYPCYGDGSSCKLEHVYIGSPESCVFQILTENLPAFVIGLFFTILAVILMGYYLYYFIRYKSGRDFLFVGIAIFTASLWVSLDTGIFSFTWGNAPLFQLLSDIILLMIPLSFGLICSYRATGKYKVLLNLYTLICELNLIVSFFMFFIGGVDFYHTKWTTILLNIIAVPLLCRLVFTYQDGNKIIRNNVIILTFLIISIACGLMWIFRVTKGFDHDTSFLIRTSIICFNFCIIVYHAKMKIVTFRKKYKNQIVHEFQKTDRVTGFLNRTALTENSFKYMNSSKNCVVGVAYFKLRHVKQVNETYGYENGTVMLQEFTSIVRSAFPENCDCYRIGTRKFYVMIPSDNPSEIYANAITTIDKNVKELNDFRNNPYPIVYNSSFVYDKNIGLFDLMDIAVERI